MSKKKKGKDSPGLMAAMDMIAKDKAVLPDFIRKIDKPVDVVSTITVNAPNPDAFRAAADHILSTREANPGYHLAKIEKGILGRPSKIKEECDEFMDAIDQGSKIMALLELADLIGAIEAYLEENYDNIRFCDLNKMKEITKRAFESGKRG